MIEIDFSLRSRIAPAVEVTPVKGIVAQALPLLLITEGASNGLAAYSAIPARFPVTPLGVDPDQ